jgi:hypothetical protein
MRTSLKAKLADGVKLETLTSAQERHLEQVAKRYIAELVKSPKFNLRHVLAWLDVAYGLYDMKRPARVEVVASPQAALKLASELTGEKELYMDWCGVGDGGWIAFYECFADFGILKTDEAAEVLILREFGRSAWDSVLLDECAIVVRRPAIIRVDDAGNLHSTMGPCIEWGDGERDYAFHGTWVPERMVLAPRGYSKAEYLAVTNTEERRALSEMAGWDWIVSLLGGSVADTWEDPSTKLTYELFACEGGQKVLRKLSPALKRGAQPLYVEPVHEDLRTARAARKWQAIPGMTAAQCEADPELSYGSET